MNRNDWLRDVVKTQLGDVVQTAIEIGVWRGDFTGTMNSSLNPVRTIGVDPYLLYEGYTDKPDVNEFANQENLDQLYERVQKRFTSEGWELVRKQSVHAATDWADNSVDFVYLDGDHKYEPVLQDIEAWWPKIRPGGIWSGHDYTEGSHIEKFGVIQAVTEFREKHNLPLNTTTEAFATWWVVK